MPIYLDYQASTPVDSAILRTMLPYFTESFANPHSAGHAAGWDADRAIEAAQIRIASYISCDPDEIIFTSGATESNNLAILGLRKLLVGGNRNKIVTTTIEHKSVLDPCRVAAEDFGAVINRCNVDEDGYISEEELEAATDENTLLVTFGSVNGEIGTIQRVDKIYKRAARFGALVHLDAAQMPVASDMSAITSCADLISLSGHKMYGPKGVGCLYVRREIQNMIAPLIFGGGQQRNIRSGTLPVPLCVGMGAAAEVFGSCQGEREKLRAKTAKFWNGLNTLGFDILLNGPSLSERHPGNLNVRFPGYEAEDILAALQPHLAASTGSACTSGTPQASHVLRGIGLTEEEARSSLRFSVGYVTTEEEIVRAIELVGSALRRLGSVNSQVWG
ncbi:cysteine desulfurase family protein [Devosia marina]|nr:cysteine desulfurase family protein [Devosia marina]